jgi:hypothetical protein
VGQERGPDRGLDLPRVPRRDVAGAPDEPRSPGRGLRGPGRAVEDERPRDGEVPGGDELGLDDRRDVVLRDVPRAVEAAGHGGGDRGHDPARGGGVRALLGVRQCQRRERVGDHRRDVPRLQRAGVLQHDVGHLDGERLGDVDGGALLAGQCGRPLQLEVGEDLVEGDHGQRHG